MKATRYHRLNRRAFSLVEVVLALGILAFCVLPVLGLLSVALTATRSTMDINLKTRMLQTARTYFLDRPFSSLTGDTVNIFFDAEGAEVGDSQIARYRLEAHVSKDVALPGANLRSLKRLVLSINNKETGETFINHFHVPDNGF